MSVRIPIGLLVVSLWLTAPVAHAATVTNSVGNAAHGFTDGQILGIADIIGAGTTVASSGSDPISNFDATWTHSFGAIAETITSATLRFGIYDSDAGGVGTDGTTTVTLADEQLDFFTVGSADESLRAELIAAGFEDGGQALNNQYEEYQISLPGTLYADIATGTLDIDLGLQGPAVSPGLLPSFPAQVANFNGANVIFSTLTITTVAVPEPSSMAALSLVALVGPVVRARRKKRSSRPA